AEHTDIEVHRFFGLAIEPQKRGDLLHGRSLMVGEGRTVCPPGWSVCVTTGRTPMPDFDSDRGIFLGRPSRRRVSSGRKLPAVACGGRSARRDAGENQTKNDCAAGGLAGVVPDSRADWP